MFGDTGGDVCNVDSGLGNDCTGVISDGSEDGTGGAGLTVQQRRRRNNQQAQQEITCRHGHVLSSLAADGTTCVSRRRVTRRWCAPNSVRSDCAPRLLSPELWAGMLPLLAAHRQLASNELPAFRSEKYPLGTRANSASADLTVTQVDITTELLGIY